MGTVHGETERTRDESAATAERGHGRGRGQALGPSPTPALVAYLQRARTAPLPAPVRTAARAHLLDTLAAIVACGELEPARAARRYVRAQAGLGEAASVLPSGERTTLLGAIFANAMTAHAHEINDFNPGAFVQPGPAVVATALAICEQRGLSGEALLRALVAGYELSGRVPRALGTENLKGAGLSTHAVGATFGAAATAAVLLPFAERQHRHTLAYAAQQASGSYNWVRDAAHVEKAFVFGGMPARSGASAALMVEQGFCGVDDPFTGFPNFLLRRAFVGERSDMDLSLLTRDLGERFELERTAFKRYPVGGPTQPAVEALLSLAPRPAPAEVVKVRVELPFAASTFRDARMPALSLPYLMALILEDGALDFEEAQSLERMASPSIRRLMARVEVRHDPAQEREPRVESARVSVTLRDGRRQSRFVEHVLGFPAHPMGPSDVHAKALSLLAPRLGIGAAERLCALCWNVDLLDSVTELVAAITRARRSEASPAREHHARRPDTP